MNKNIVLGMVAPYLHDKELTYDEFEKIFNMLSKQEQYAVIDILNTSQIELVDFYSDSSDDEQELDVDDTDVDEFELLYDDELFSDIDSKDDQTGDYSEVGNGNEYLKIRKNITLSNKSLIRMIQNGDAQAKQDLCIKNRGLVDKWVGVYQHYLRNKLDFEDLEQAGMLGMVKAAEKFDLNLGTEFSTYAVWWIKQAITREILDNGYTIRIPVHMMEKVQKVVKQDSKYSYIKDYRERIEMVSAELGVTTEEVETCLRLVYQFIQSTSLDLPIGEDEDTPLEDLVPIEDEVSVEDLVAQKIARERIEDVLETLTEREQKILRLRFGLDDGRARTLEELGQIFNVTRERIRQIEAKALRKLRRLSRSKRLKDFLD